MLKHLLASLLLVLVMVQRITTAETVPRLWLTINAKQNLVEISWQNALLQPGDQIIVTNVNGTEVRKLAIPVTTKNSRYTTNFKFNYKLERNFTTQTGCYEYWARYVTAQLRTVSSTCLSAQPRWMHTLHPFVQKLRIRDLFLPGTHDSGAYQSGLSQPIFGDIVGPIAVTQDLDIWNQLMHGVRYLDMRIGINSNVDDTFYVYHSDVRFDKLSLVIEQVKKFVSETGELVVFGLKEFPVGFDGPDSQEMHIYLANFLRSSFSDIYVNASLTWDASIGKILNTNRNVILAYDHRPTVALFSDVLFPAVTQRWGNVNKRTALETYLRSINAWDPQRFVPTPAADMAELTPNFIDVVILKRNLREMADDVNPTVTALYRDELGQNANIVAVDFLLGTNIVELALERNLQKLQNINAFG